MSQVTEAPSPAAAATEEHSLAKNALGLPQVLFCIVTGAAPICTNRSEINPRRCGEV